MPAEGPGKRYSVTATKATVHGQPVVELSHPGIAAKSMQAAPAVPSVANATAATHIAVGEEMVIMLDGSHSFSSTLLPAGAKAGDKLWISPADNSLSPISSAGAVNAQVKLTVSATGGTLTVTIDGEVSGAIPWNATPAELREKLEGMSNINPGDVTVTGGPGDAGGTKPYVITFAKGRYAGLPKPALATATGALEGTKTAVFADVVVGVAGVEAVKFGIIDEIDATNELAHVNLSLRSAF